MPTSPPGRRPDCSRSAGGSIVLVSSAAARLGSPFEYVDYAGSKAALDTLAVGLAKELAEDGVRVNSVRPGLMATDIYASGGQPNRAERLGSSTPMGRPGRPEEVAEAIVRTQPGTWQKGAAATCYRPGGAALTRDSISRAALANRLEHAVI